MSQPGMSLRDQGIQALREGKIDQAVDMLARAVMADDRDADAKALLGVAYSQKGLHQQAVRALTTAVELQPKNAMYRFNLGIALERAGDAAGAAFAFRDAVQLSPDHAQARGKLEAMGVQAQQLLTGSRPNSAGPSPFPAPPQPAVPGGGQPQMAPPSFIPPGASGPNVPGAGAPPAFIPPASGAPAYAPPPIGGTPSPGAATMVGAPPPMQAPLGAAPIAGYGAPPTMDAPPGTVQCPGCGQFSKVGMICEFCSTPLPPPPRPVAPPSFQPSFTPMPIAAGAGGGYFDMSNGEAFFRRFVATFIDGILVGGLSFGVGIVLGLVAATSGRGEDPSIGFMAQGAGIVIQAGYFGGMMSTTGATLGKMAMGLKVTGPDGGNPSFFRSVFREGIGKFISGILCALGYLWMLWDDNQETWHDKLFGTSVIRVR